MKKNKKLLVIIGLVALVVCLSLALIFGLFFRNNNGQDTTPTTGTDPVLHTICVSTSNEIKLADVGVYVYTDSTCNELVWFAKTDENGEMSFTDVESDSYVAVLENVPTGYAVEEYYPLTGVETNIVLSVGQMTEEDMQTLTYKLGDVVMDFSVTAVDGTVYTLSELLEEKQAVVLNFWFLNCQPCLMEFPYLQEAYAEYSDDIAVIAMNPVDKMEDILAFQAEHGYAFPLAAVEEAWVKIMQVSAFPTTVVIDRFGNITLMHTGSIDNAQTFKDVFAYFCAEEYEQKFFTDITELESEKEEGSEENPTELGGVESFDVTVAPGQVYYTELYKVSNMYLTIYSKDAYVLYNDKKYEPNKGVISILLTCPDMYTPVKVGIGNSSEKEQTFKVYLVPKAGTFNNPFPLKMGEFTASVEAGNEVGIYYLYTATEDGVLTMKCLSATPGVKYTYYLYNLSSYALRNLEEDGTDGEDGIRYISVPVKKGQQIQFSIGTLPDETNSYPGGKFQMLATFDNGAVVERPMNEQITYRVELKDQNGKPVPDVPVQFSGEVTLLNATDTEAAVKDTIEQYVNTDTNGVATLTQYPGTLQIMIRTPEGYTLETNTYTLTADKPTITVQLHKIQYKDYTVSVKTPTGEGVEGMILIAGSKVGYTDAEGKAVFNLPADTYSFLVLGVPAGYELAQNAYELTADNTQLSVTLSYEPGHETNPIVISECASFVMQGVKANAVKHYTVHDGGATKMSIAMVNGFYITVNGTQYEPDIDGVITVDLTAVDDTFSLAVHNTDVISKDIQVSFAFPSGTRYNPASWNLTRGSSFTVSQPGDEKFFFTTAGKTTTNGYINITVVADTFTGYDVIVTNGKETARMSDGHDDGEFTFNFTGNDNIVMQIIATEELSESVSVKVKGSISRQSGTSYSVTVVDTEGNPMPGVAMQFVQNETTASDVFTTDTSGVVSVALPTESYHVVLKDTSLAYDTTTAVVTSSATAVTIVANRTQEPIPEGMTRYTVTITDFSGNLVGDHVLLFMQDGVPVGYNIVDSTGGVTTLDLPTGEYKIQMACLGETQYYFETANAVVTEEAPELTLQVATAPTSSPQENWKLAEVIPVGVGGTYVTLQKDMETYFSFAPSQQGVYRITITDPDAILRYWGATNFPTESSSLLEDYTKYSFTISVNTNALGQEHAFGISGSEDSLVIINREGDAVEDIPFVEYVATKTPVAQSLPAGLKFTKFDLTKPTGTYNLVLNPNDGYYHLGSANGPVVYVQLTFDKTNSASPKEPAYVHLYKMVGGVDNTGTALRSRYQDADGNDVREDYTACMLQYGACADKTYGVYPLTEDLKHMIQKGGAYQGWWDAGNVKGNLLFKEGENLEIAWMFALCYIQ